MTRNWTFGQKVGGGFAIVILLTIAIAVIGIYALQQVAASTDQVLHVNSQLLLDAEKASGTISEKSAAARAFLLTKEDRYLDQVREAREEFGVILARLRRNVTTDEERTLVVGMETAEREHHEGLTKLFDLRRGNTPIETIAASWDEQLAPTRKKLASNLTTLVTLEEGFLRDANRSSTETTSRSTMLVIVIGLGAVVLAISIAILLTRALAQQIGTAVSQVQSSSAELQAAANQQAAGAREQATAMNEITTTISELLATSSQIAESAQRVAHIADQTANSARSGDGTVDKAHEAIIGIRKQVDLIVNHMLELGKKSQQIGAVLEIVSELAEQTNILAINATIEAAGAGESGKRFSVVADEIRKLADRVASSTKEIRDLIDDVRSAVNTTVMATETGSKAVDTGSKHFGDVATSFKQIASLVTTTTEAAREIELSTKQQTTAVQQVNIAVSNTAQATKETETTSTQTLQTAVQLATLSKDLLRLVRPQTAA